MRNFDTIFNLQDRNIVITGSSGTLGTQFSHILSSVGANVILVDIDTKNNKNETIFVFFPINQLIKNPTKLI